MVSQKHADEKPAGKRKALIVLQPVTVATDELKSLRSGTQLFSMDYKLSFVCLCVFYPFYLEKLNK